jgi:hypothetical protein
MKVCLENLKGRDYLEEVDLLEDIVKMVLEERSMD